jgi:hypothetical protein
VTLLLVALWLVLLRVGARWFVPHPGRVPWLAVVGLLVWLPVIVVGTSQLGWGR